MAIGGVIKRKTTENVRKTPILGDIPIIGALFRKTAVDVGGGYGEKGDTELFITLTPTIISGKKDTLETRKEVKIARAPSGVDENLADPVKEYARIVQQRILENLTYPALAKEATFQGTVRLRLHISRYGELLDAQIKESSGHNMLDDHALSVAREAASYPPFPSSIGQEELWIEVPIAYQLD
jgi:TonB family protein